MQFLEIEAHGALALHGERLARDVGGDEGIAVAVAADPASHAQEGRHLDVLPGRVGGAEQALEIGVEQRQRAQEGVVVVGQPVGDLVDDAQTRAAHQAGLPQREHVAAQRPAVGGELLRRELDPVALVEQAGDLHLAVDRALAADLRRMRRQHRAAQGVVEEALQLLARHAAPGARGPAHRPWCPAAAAPRPWRRRACGGCGAGPRRCWRDARNSRRRG